MKIMLCALHELKMVIYIKGDGTTYILTKFFYTHER